MNRAKIMKIGIIGCGNMGWAILTAMLARRYCPRKYIFVTDKDKSKLDVLRRKHNINVVNSNSELTRRCNVIIFAVKPQDLAGVIEDTALRLQGKLLISVCAGVGTESLQRCLGKIAIVRVMPNMPAVIGQGISAIAAGRYATKKDAALVKSIFSCIGDVIEVKEGLMDAVTAISGSGPAYFFYFTQKIIEAAKELGLSASLARRLAVKTAVGSALLMEYSQQDLAILKRKVASKGGTTEAAFKVLEKEGLDRILTAAVKAAAQRSKQLRKAFNNL